MKGSSLAMAIGVLACCMLTQSHAQTSKTCRHILVLKKELADSAENLYQCADSKDLSDDCSSEFSTVRSDAEDLEDAVSEANGDCE
jgi:hypothetical protein